MSKKSMYGLSCMVILLFCFFITPSAKAGSAEEEVLELEKNWIKAFNTVDYELASSLYWHSPKTTESAPDVTFSQGYDAIIEGMKFYFASDSPHVSKWSLDNTQVIMLSDNAAIIIGFHDLLNVRENRKSRHRFTRVVQKIDGKWLIVHNHESKVQTIAAPDITAPTIP